MTSILLRSSLDGGAYMYMTAVLAAVKVSRRRLEPLVQCGRIGVWGLEGCQAGPKPKVRARGRV